jgi:CRP-like cAMP-binding protein
MKGYALNYEVSSDSLFLIQNRLFLSLYQLASLTSIVAISALPIMLIDSLPFKTAILQISSILFFIELNPYGKTELNAFLKSLYPDEIMGRVSEFLRSKSVLSLVHPASTKHFHYAVYMAFYFNLVWCSVATYASANAIWQNYNFITSDMTANKISMLFGILSLGIIFTFGFIAGYNFISIFTVRIITAFVFIKKFLHKHSTSIKVDHYNHNEILGVLDDLPLFSYFPRELLNMIVQKSTVMEFSKNSHVIIQGTVGKELFILLSGKLEILKRNGVHVEEHLGEIHPTSIFGEIAVLEDIPRMADVIAQENSIVLSIPASTLRIAANDSPYSRELEIFRDAITVNQFFNSAPFFRDLSPRVIQMFISKGRYESYDKDTYVFKQGDHGESFYLLLRGHVSVQVNGMPIARISQGGFFGEISLIASVPRTGSVMALTKLDVLEIRRDSFWEILSQDLQIALFIESIGELRIIQDIEALKGPNSKIA